MPSSSTGPAAATETTIRLGSSTHRSASWCACGAPQSRRRGSSLPDDCLFCRLYREGEHVCTGPGFVAVRDINPKADTHLLVIPERHVETFREVDQFTPEEAQRMLAFIAEAARHERLDDYRVVVNGGEGAGQTIFHLHWHVLGGRVKGLPA